MQPVPAQVLVYRLVVSTTSTTISFRWEVTEDVLAAGVSGILTIHRFAKHLRIPLSLNSDERGLVILQRGTWIMGFFYSAVFPCRGRKGPSSFRWLIFAWLYSFFIFRLSSPFHSSVYMHCIAFYQMAICPTDCYIGGGDDLLKLWFIQKIQSITCYSCVCYVSCFLYVLFLFPLLICSLGFVKGPDCIII